MMHELLPWKRYWCRLDGQVAFGSDGYPYDPEDENLGCFTRMFIHSINYLNFHV